MKSIGLIFLSAIPVVLALRTGEELRKSMRQRTEFLKLLLWMHFQIENFSRDQKEIFNSFQSPILQKTAFFRELQNRLEIKASGAFGSAWKTWEESFAFEPKSREMIDHFAEHFGFLEKTAQLSQLERVIKELKSKETDRIAQCENKIKILRISGWTAGLGIFILLI